MKGRGWREGKVALPRVLTAYPPPTRSGFLLAGLPHHEVLPVAVMVLVPSMAKRRIDGRMNRDGWSLRKIL
ncbi:unnamed protein product [Victoria cruziana]